MSTNLTTIETTDLETITGGLPSGITEDAVGIPSRRGGAVAPFPYPTGDPFTPPPKEDPTKLIYAPRPQHDIR
jgi:hypothetical protein